MITNEKNVSFKHCNFYGCPLNHINEGCNQSYYEFEIPVSFTPSDSIIYIGDTVSVSSFIPKEKWDQGSNYVFILDSVDFYMGGGVIKLDTLIEEEKQYNFMNDFEWIADDIYNFKIGSNAYAFDYQYSEEGYFIQFEMIPKQKGVYLFDIRSLIIAAHSIDAEVISTSDGECMTDAWYPNCITNEGDNYKELLLLSPTPYYKEYYYDHWGTYNHSYGAHCFKVE